MTGYVATAETDIAASPERVWEALTEPDQIAVWMQGSRVETTLGGRARRSPGTASTTAAPTRTRARCSPTTSRSVLSVTHYSPMMGQPDEPENYHTLVYTLTADSPTTVTHLELTQDGNESQEQADQFGQNWQTMLDGLKAHVEG